ncbi:MAG: hypothetical protein J5824_03700, partial [Lachnospiraceae bacterium]|nr:hypothetical protein [Lachnospiraceae bacterium]
MHICDNNLVDNAGTITLKFLNPAETDRNMSFVIQQGYYEDRAAEVNNSGSIVNNGYIAKTNKDKELNWKGNKWTGSGKEGDYLYGSSNDPDDPVYDPVINPQPGGGSGGGTSNDPAGGGDAQNADTPAPKGTSLEPASTSDPKAVYKVSSSDSKAPTVTYQKVADKKAKSVTVPATVKVGNVTYKVTPIADNAFKN